MDDKPSEITDSRTNAEKMSEFPNFGLKPFPKVYCKQGDYPMELIIWIEESLKDALTDVDARVELIGDALDRLTSLKRELLGEQ